MKGLVIGFGNMGKLHAEIYRELGVDVYIYDIDPRRISEAEEFGFKHSKPSEDFDFFDICTPTYTHFKLIQELKKYGKPIVVEKPVVLKREEAEAIRGRKDIFVAEPELFNPALKPFMEDNSREYTIERLVNLELFTQGGKIWFTDFNLSGGIVLDLLIHDLSYLRVKYGVNPEILEVGARKERYEPFDNVEIVLDYGETLVNLKRSWTYDGEILLKIKSDSLTVNYSEYLKTIEPYRRELEAFLEFVNSGELPYPLDIFLDAIETALDINEKIFQLGGINYV